jgi:hypothetical protein
MRDARRVKFEPLKVTTKYTARHGRNPRNLTAKTQRREP